MSCDTPLREIRLYGVLARKFGRVHRLAVSSAAEAVRALTANFSAFGRHLREHSEAGYHVWIGRENIGEDDLALPAGRDDVIRIAPALAGSKKQGLIQTIIGAVLIAVAFFVPGPWSPYLYATGASLMLGGVAQMLTPMPKLDRNQADNKASYVFSGAQNVSAQGIPVPVLYGQLLVGSAVISAGIYTEQMTA